MISTSNIATFEVNFVVIGEDFRFENINVSPEPQGSSCRVAG
jgi:hypothetical protein